MQQLLQQKKLFAVALIMLLVLVLVPTAAAFEGRDGNTVTIAADEVIEDDLYIGADHFILEGTVKGDLLVGGTIIEINGTVEGDLWAAGQHIIINGTVMDDARIGGMAIDLGESAQIGDDLLVGGYSLHTQSGSQVDGDLLFGGAQALLEGSVDEDVLVGTNGLAINGRVGGDVTAEVGAPGSEPPVDPISFMDDAPSMPSVPVGLTLGETADISGEVSYKATAPSSGETGAETAFTDRGSENRALDAVWSAVRRLIALVLISLLLIQFLPDWPEQFTDFLEAKPLPSLGWGAAVYAVFPLLFLGMIGAFILLAIIMSVIGLGNLSITILILGATLLIAAFVLYVMVLLYLTKIMIGYVIGKYVLTLAGSKLVDNKILTLLPGLALIVIAISIPFLGPLLNLIIALAGLGPIWLFWRERDTLVEKVA